MQAFPETYIGVGYTFSYGTEGISKEPAYGAWRPYAPARLSLHRRQTQLAAANTLTSSLSKL